MRRPSVSIPVLITALLAAILLIYVFVGGRGRADARPHCGSRETLALIKRDIFDRAAGLRGGSDARFAALANYSVLRASSTLVRRLYAGTDEVGCSGTLALDLPPGVAAPDGRHSLAAQLSYNLKAGREGMVQLDGLTNAEAIAAPLAGAVQAPPAAPPPAPVQQPNGVATTPLPPSPSPPPPPPPARPSAPRAEPQPAAPRPPAPPHQPAPKPQPAAESPRPSAPQPQPAPAHEPAPKPSEPRTPAPARVASSPPSFNCRHAHTRGEMTVCANPSLAELDHQMAVQFHRAMAAARPGQRDMLRRTGRRFIRYRDSCPTTGCMADAYRGRIREINDIMDGPW